MNLAELGRCCSLSVLGLLVACGAGKIEPKAPDYRIKKDTRVSHAPCELESATERLDANEDGRAEFVSARGGAGLRCARVDLDLDGVADAWVYRDAQGKLERREFDFDRDGSADEIALYKGGVLIERQRSTVVPGRLDTWHGYTLGKLAKTVRDSNGDSYVDQWWEYPQGESSGCPVVHSDVDGDGRPDPGATVDVCGVAKEEFAAGERSGLDPGGLQQVTIEESAGDGSQDAKPSAPAPPPPAGAGEQPNGPKNPGAPKQGGAQ